MNCKGVAWKMLFLFMVAVSPLWAAPDEGTPAAKVEFAKGEAAANAGDFLAAAEHYRKAVEIDPDYGEAHQRYIDGLMYGSMKQKMKEWDEAHPKAASSDKGASDKAREERSAYESEKRNEKRATLSAQYQKLAEQYPDKAIFRWVLGYLNDESDPRVAEQDYLEAIKIDPKLARAYSSLWAEQDVMGEASAKRETLRKAVETFPADPNFLLYYATALEYVDPEEYKRISMEVVEKFPNSERAPQALYWLAEHTADTDEKIRLLEVMKEKFPPAKFKIWVPSGMVVLFDIYDRVDRSKALSFAEQMLKSDTQKDDREIWAQRVDYARLTIKADKLLAEGNVTDALAVLDKVTVPRHMNPQLLDLLRARALDASGDTAKAYSDLLKKFAVTPTDEVNLALNEYGKKLGKAPKQVESDIWSLRSANAHSATPFSLVNYSTGKPTSLQDFRGQVVLLNFWYPHCGPCRGEFPYVEAVLDKYKSQGFNVVAVNINPEEDKLVLPLLKGSRLDFVPLKGDVDWAEEAYKVSYEPTNFLIGRDGRVYFGPLGRINGAESQRNLELQVEALLQQTTSTSTR